MEEGFFDLEAHDELRRYLMGEEWTDDFEEYVVLIDEMRKHTNACESKGQTCQVCEQFIVFRRQLGAKKFLTEPQKTYIRQTIAYLESQNLQQDIETLNE